MSSQAKAVGKYRQVPDLRIYLPRVVLSGLVSAPTVPPALKRLHFWLLIKMLQGIQERLTILQGHLVGQMPRRRVPSKHHRDLETKSLKG